MSNQPYAATTTRVIEYAEPSRGWQHYSTLPEAMGELETFNAVQRCRAKHPGAEVRLTVITESRYAAAPKPAKWDTKNRTCTKCSKDPSLPEPCSEIDCPYVYS